MRRLLKIALVAICASGCSTERSDAPEPAQAEPERRAEASVTMDESAVSGESAYNIACASCHDTGENGAPLTGAPDYWSDRSPLWEAVLADHAKKGYMKMPAKGGMSELPDQVVVSATEYMMLLTYPNRPRD